MLGNERVEAVPMRGDSKIEVVSDEARGSQGAQAVRNSGLFFLTKQEDDERQRKIVELYDQYSSYLYKYLRTLRLDEGEAEDVVQETFLRLANHLITGAQDVNLRSWLFQVAHNLSMDIHRASERDRPNPEEVIKEEPADPKFDPERIYLQKEAMKRVNQAMTQLTTKQRNGILLRAQGLRYGEIGSVLGVTESRAIYLVKRALKRLTGGL